MTDPLYQVDESQSVICPTLYNKLKQHFHGGVIIANQGERFSCISPIAVTGKRRTFVQHSGEYYRVNCPFCANETRHRLWINHMYGQPDVNGKAMYFLATCYNEDCLSKTENWQKLKEVIFGFQNVADRRIPQFPLNMPTTWCDPSDMRVAEPPGEVIPMSQLMRSVPDHPAVQWMCGVRHYTQHMFDYYGISYCIRAHSRYPLAQNRIIFPIYMREQLVGWQARYVGTTDWHLTPKYYGLPGMPKRLMLYNYDKAKTQPFVVLVEGVTDCHVIGDPAVAVLGKTVTAVQFELIVNTWDGKPVILIFDPEAQEEMQKVMYNLQQQNMVTVPVTLPAGYDCGDYAPRSIWDIIYAQARQLGVVLPRIA